MNPNKDKIGWCDYSINPVVGCNEGCPWCYARRQAKRQKKNCFMCWTFIPHPHLDRLKQLSPKQKPKKIFINSMYDWNGMGVYDQWLIEIVQKMTECDNHIFQILSKNPLSYSRWTFPDNVWLGTSVINNAMVDNIKYLIMGMEDNNRNNISFASFEPLLGEIKEFQFVDWVIIGPLSRVGKKPKQPKKEWVQAILDHADHLHIPVFMKPNLEWDDPRKEFPKSKW